MRALLDTLGATVWGVVAIILAAAVATLGYRLTLNHPAYLDAIESGTPGATASRAARATAALPVTPGEPRAMRALPPARTARGSSYGWPDTTVERTEQPVSSASIVDEPLIGHFVRPPAVSRAPALKVAQTEFEKALATGAATPEETAQMTKTLFAIAASTNQFQKAIDYGKQMVDAGTATTENLLIISQSYYQLKDCKDAVIWADKGIAAARKAGETPKENFYLFKLQCASDSQDNNAMDPVLIDLIKLNNKTTYWNSLLRIERQDERDDHNTLMIYRIMYNTQSMKEDTDYIEMAQLLGDAALPGEAAALRNKAMSSGIIKDEHKERTQRLLDALQGRADADRERLAQLAAEAAANPAGELLTRLGEIYYGFGDYPGAIEAIAQGLQKGQVRHLDQAYVYLGLAEVQLHNAPAARAAFDQLKSVPNVSLRLLKLWGLYAATLSMKLAV